MNTQAPGDVTALLHKWHEGDAQALAELVPLVYAELQQLARQCLRGEQAAQAVHTGTLVHEAYLRLCGCQQLAWQDRHHFFAIAARVMRRVLVEEARRRSYQKRGGAGAQVLLDDALLLVRERDAELLALDEALDRLAHYDERKCRVVELRYFAGLTIEETAQALGVSVDIVKREWGAAKLWLRRELQGRGEAGHG